MCSCLFPVMSLPLALPRGVGGMLIQIFGTQLRFACALILCLLAAPPLAAQEVTGVPQIVDADTIYLNSFKIRLNGIDAPETDQFCLDARGQNWTCGIEATSRLRAFSGNRPWACHLAGTDRYGRSLGSCKVGGGGRFRWVGPQRRGVAFRRF